MKAYMVSLADTNEGKCGALRFGADSDKAGQIMLFPTRDAANPRLAEALKTYNRAKITKVTAAPNA